MWLQSDDGIDGEDLLPLVIADLKRITTNGAVRHGNPNHPGGGAVRPHLQPRCMAQRRCVNRRGLCPRVTTRMINRMDELDGDIDLEPDDDCCSAGDDDRGRRAIY